MALARTSTQLLRSQGNDSTTVAANYPITGDGSTMLPLGIDADYRGADGESLTFNITDIDNGHRVTISGSQGTSSFNVLDGTDGVNGVNGTDGKSVTFDIADIANGHKVTLSGAQGSASFDVMNGVDGVDGVSPTFRFTEFEDKVVVYVSGAQGENSFTLYNGVGHEYSAGPNINISDYTISGKDWSSEIASAISSVSGNYYPMTGNPSGFLTAVDLSNYYTKNETSSRAEISAAFDAIPSVVEYSAGQNINITDHIISSKDWSTEISNASSACSAVTTAWVNEQNYLTAHQSLDGLMSSNKLEYDSNNNKISGYNGSAFAGSTYDVTAGANINVTTAGNTFSISGKDWSDTITAASAYAASQSQGKTYTGAAPIVVNNTENTISANCIELSAGSGIDSNKLAIGVIEVSGGLGDDIFTYQFSTPSTSYTVHSGLMLRNYQQHDAVYRRFYVDNSPVGDIVPTAYLANQYLTTNSLGVMQWENKQESITDCTVMMDNASMSSVDLSSYTAYKQVTFVTPHLNTYEGGTSSYDLYINGTKKIDLLSSCYYSFVQQKKYDSTAWFGANSGYTKWIDN